MNITVQPQTKFPIPATKQRVFPFDTGTSATVDQREREEVRLVCAFRRRM